LRGQATVEGDDLRNIFPGCDSVLYEFSIGSSSVVVTNLTKSTDGTISKSAGSAVPQCGHAHIITIAALGCGAPRRNGEIHICRNTGIPAKSVNYFYGNMKDAEL